MLTKLGSKEACLQPKLGCRKANTSASDYTRDSSVNLDSLKVFLYIQTSRKAYDNLVRFMSTALNTSSESLRHLV